MIWSSVSTVECICLKIQIPFTAAIQCWKGCQGCVYYTFFQRALMYAKSIDKFQFVFPRQLSVEKVTWYWCKCLWNGRWEWSGVGSSVPSFSYKVQPGYQCEDSLKARWALQLQKCSEQCYSQTWLSIILSLCLYRKQTPTVRLATPLIVVKGRTTVLPTPTTLVAEHLSRSLWTVI